MTGAEVLFLSSDAERKSGLDDDRNAVRRHALSRFADGGDPP
jgi:hypothetical protein